MPQGGAPAADGPRATGGPAGGGGPVSEGLVQAGADGDQAVQGGQGDEAAVRFPDLLAYPGTANQLSPKGMLAPAKGVEIT